MSHDDEDAFLSPKVKVFLDEVRSVCRKHGLQISTSGYDGLDVFDLLPGDEELHPDWINDMTEGDE